MSGVISPPARLTAQQRRVLAALADAVLPSVDGYLSATELGIIEVVEATMTSPHWSGARFYGVAPYDRILHSGHGWQGPNGPAALFAATLDELATELDRRTAAEVVAAAIDGQVATVHIESADFIDLLRRLIVAIVAKEDE